MADLLDVNVWFSLSVEDHIHHQRSVRYWETEAHGERLFCRSTELALLRLLSNPRALGDRALGGGDAWRALRSWLAVPHVRHLDEPQVIDEFLGAWGADLDIRGRIWSDAYLAAFAMASGSRLVSFDTGFEHYPGLSWLHLRS